MFGDDDVIVNLCGRFMSVGGIYIFNVHTLVKICKFNYDPNSEQKLRLVGGENPSTVHYCILVNMSEHISEVLTFTNEHVRDTTFARIERALTYVIK